MRRVVWCAWVLMGACVAVNGDYAPPQEAGTSTGRASTGEPATTRLETGGTAVGGTEVDTGAGSGLTQGLDATSSETSEGAGETEGSGAWVFEGVELVEELDAPGYDDDDPSLRFDRLEIYFASNRPINAMDASSDEDVYVSTRTSAEDPWGEPVRLPSPINGSADDTSPELSADGLTMTIASDRPGPQAMGGLDLYLLTRASLGTDWSEPVHITELNAGQVDGSGALTGDALRIFFCSIRGGVGNEDVFVAERASDEVVFGAPIRLGGEINSDYLDCNPFVDALGGVMLFATARGGVTDSDLAVVEDEGAGFGSVVFLEGEVNTTAREMDPWLSSDGEVLYFSRSLPSPEANIYRAFRVW